MPQASAGPASAVEPEEGLGVAVRAGAGAKSLDSLPHLRRGDRVLHHISGSIPVLSSGPMATEFDKRLGSESSLIVWRHSSGPRITWLESWTCSFLKSGWHGVWLLVVNAVCQCGGLLGVICAHLCAFSLESSLQRPSFFHLSCFLLSLTPPGGT